jgi:hypothetical protein
VGTLLPEDIADQPHPQLGVYSLGDLEREDAVGAVACKLFRAVRAEHERDVVAAELARQLPSFCEQLE